MFIIARNLESECVTHSDPNTRALVRCNNIIFEFINITYKSVRYNYKVITFKLDLNIFVVCVD